MKEIKVKLLVEPWAEDTDGFADPDGYEEEITITEEEVRDIIEACVDDDSTEEDAVDIIFEALSDDMDEKIHAPREYNDDYMWEYCSVEESTKLDGFIREVVSNYHLGEHTPDPDGKIYVLHFDTEAKLFKTVAGMRKFVEDFEHDADEQTEFKIVHDATQKVFRCYEYDANVEKDCCVDIWGYDLCEIND